MTSAEILALYGRVQKGERAARDTFKLLYAERFPHNGYLVERGDRAALHTMYLHLVKPGGKPRPARRQR